MEKKECPVLTATTTGPLGPVLMQDVQLIEQMQRFNRERIPQRRCHRRHDVETQDLTIERWDGGRRPDEKFARIMDLSAGGIRLRTHQASLQPGNQIRIRLELPEFAGIKPFIHVQENGFAPMNEWIGWITVNRVVKINKDEYDVAGQLLDMDEIDRSMLGLYLSMMPLAVPAHDGEGGTTWRSAAAV
jgi:hypothetical protein